MDKRLALELFNAPSLTILRLRGLNSLKLALELMEVETLTLVWPEILMRSCGVSDTSSGLMIVETLACVWCVHVTLCTLIDPYSKKFELSSSPVLIFPRLNDENYFVNYLDSVSAVGCQQTGLLSGHSQSPLSSLYQ